MNKQIKLEYGMKILFPCSPVMIVPALGIALTSSSDKTQMVEMEVSKYWNDDVDANSYKVKLVPVSEENKKLYGNEKLYSSDLKQLINDGTAKLV